MSVDACLRVLGGDAAKKLEAALSDDTVVGVGKALVMAGAEAGFDMQSREGIEAWMQSMMNKPLPSSHQRARRGTRQSARRTLRRPSTRMTQMTEWTAETAEWYAENYGEYPTNRRTVERLELAPDATILDVGCGTAAALRHAAAKVPTGRLVGVDPVPRMVELAKAKLASDPAWARIEVHLAPAHALPLDDASVDVVLALDSYDHWAPHQREGLAEVRRVLAPGGRLVVVKDASVPYAAKAKREFLALLGKSGFEVVEGRETKEADASFTTWLCVATKPAA